jgi:hypothetical protein
MMPQPTFARPPFTRRQLLNFVNDPAKRREFLELYDVEITVDSNAPWSTADDPKIVFRTIIQPEATYLVILMPESSSVPTTFLLPGTTITEFSEDQGLHSGVYRCVKERVDATALKDGERMALEVYKLPERPACRVSGSIREGMFLPNKAPV